MNKYLQTNYDVSLCYKSSCIHAKGKNANIIAYGAFMMLLFFGISAMTKSK